ncbi:MAG: ATP-dependent Clp protease adaptor ClpS [Desulfovibrio sp.]|nr:ATP-dependent Clp protease adaptor ClpS [Desulfovibrio sp.]
MAQSDADVIIEQNVKEPRLYRVLMHNDDITTMDFVIAILCQVFNKDSDEATEIMWKIHNTGIGLCGVYPREIAETRIGRVRKAASRAGFPLKCTMEEE